MCLEEEDPSDNVRFIVMNIVEVENEAVQQEDIKIDVFWCCETHSRLPTFTIHHDYLLLRFWQLQLLLHALAHSAILVL